jgi:pyruvate dehydrogenase E1 component
MGVVMPEVLRAAETLEGFGIAVDAVCLTSADLIFRALRSRSGFGTGDGRILQSLFPEERAAPIVSVIDGHPHTLAFLGAINDTPLASLGVDDFGQTGDIDDLFENYGIDTDTLVGAALDLVD